MQAVFDLTRHEIGEICRNMARPVMHAETFYRKLYKQLDHLAHIHPDLPVNLQDGLAPLVTAEQCGQIIEVQQSKYDHSAKFRIQLRDGAEIESVLMPEEDRLTICVSSQVGCRQGCRFCQTGRMGLVRNLTAGEIVLQLFLANRWARDQQLVERLGYLRLPKRITNVVFMGMGEPLDNVDEVLRSSEILRDAYGFQLALRRLSVSTAGHLDGMRKILDQVPNLSLALSLHSPFDDERSKLMPINRRWPIAEVVEEMRRRQSQRKVDFLVQYTLLNGVNDSLDHAQAVVNLLKGLNCKINLIPFNPFDGVKFRIPSPDQVEAFGQLLHKNGMRVLIRYSKGQDIQAACGQLIKKQRPALLQN